MYVFLVFLAPKRTGFGLTAKLGGINCGLTGAVDSSNGQ
jgi:hypothetical protein